MSPFGRVLNTTAAGYMLRKRRISLQQFAQHGDVVVELCFGAVHAP